MTTKNYQPSTIINKNSDKSKAKKERHYVDKQKFYEALVQRHTQVLQAEENNQPKPIITQYIGECILKITENLAKSPSFSGYPYKDEMIGDAIVQCIRYIDKFDVTKESKNPFSYFTQTAYFSFIGRINDEHKKTYVKYKSIMEFSSMGELCDDVADLLDTSNREHPDYMNEFIRNYEEKNLKNKTEKAKKKAKSNLEDVLFGN